MLNSSVVWSLLLLCYCAGGSVCALSGGGDQLLQQTNSGLLCPVSTPAPMLAPARRWLSRRYFYLSIKLLSISFDPNPHK